MLEGKRFWMFKIREGMTDDRVFAGVPVIQEPQKFNMGQNTLGLQECIYFAERAFP